MRTGDWRGILIFAEGYQGEIKKVSLELLGEGRKLAKKLNCKVLAVMMEGSFDYDSLIGYGADTVYVLETESNGKIDDLYCSDVLCRLINEIHPEIFLVGATMFGKAIAPRIASRLGTGLTADCMEFKIDQETGYLQQIRPAYQDSMLATIICETQRPQIATVREKVFQMHAFERGRTGQIIHRKYRPKVDTKLEIIEQKEDSGRTENKEHKILFGIGKGIGSKENIGLVKRIARKYRAEIGATRSIVNEGWIEKEYQIGQTGITVRPKMYIACGISGAIQHLCGIQGAECIIAINTDGNAPIFNVADIGIRRDIVDILRSLPDDVDSAMRAIKQ